MLFPGNFRFPGRTFVFILKILDRTFAAVSDISDFFRFFLIFQGDKIQDYKCPQCGKEVEVTQTAVMKTLPRTLLVHLKRFVWNLERGREKVNDR